MSAPSRVRLAGAVDAATGAVVDMRRGRGPRVLFLPHSADCGACSAWLAGLAARSDAISEWGGRVSVVLRADHEHGAPRDPVPRIQVLYDAEASLSATPPAVIIADEWGEIHFAVEDVADHALPDHAEVVEWVRFISIHCPECEQPEGEWRSI